MQSVTFDGVEFEVPQHAINAKPLEEPEPYECREHAEDEFHMWCSDCRHAKSKNEETEKHALIQGISSLVDECSDPETLKKKIAELVMK